MVTTKYDYQIHVKIMEIKSLSINNNIKKKKKKKNIKNLRHEKSTIEITCHHLHSSS